MHKTNPTLTRVCYRMKLAVLVVTIVFLSGCAAVDQRAGFSEVGAAAKERIGMKVVWNAGTKLDADVAQEIQALLSKELSVEQAVQVALLNNRELQAMYADLGVSQADLVQAGLLENPIFDGAVLFPFDGGPVRAEIGAAVNFLSMLYVPLRKRVAAARFEDTKLQVTGKVIDFAATVEIAYYGHQANKQLVELRQTIVKALEASADFARRLHEAGNITDLDLRREQALTQEGRLELALAETSLIQTRERLNELLGVWGADTGWQIGARLPDVPEQPLALDRLERAAIQKSLDLTSARQKIIIAGEQLGLTKGTALVPDLEIGGFGEREEAVWALGPGLAFPIPLFDQGQARIGRSVAELRRARQQYYALGVQLRSSARAARARLRGARDFVLYYQHVLLPLRQEIMRKTQLHYNAMQLGVFDLLRAQEREIEAGVSYIQALRDYWLIRTEVDQLLKGRLPNDGGRSVMQLAVAPSGAEQGDH